MELRADDTTMEAKKRSYDPAALRDRLLGVAVAAFQEVGYNATSMNDIVRAADTSGGALHHHFPTKKALGLAVIRDRVAAAVEETWVRPVREAPDAAAGIRQAFAAIIAELKAKGAVSGCPLNNLALELSRQDPEFGDAIHQVFAQWRQALADKLRADTTISEARRRDADATATFIIASYSGAMAMAKAGQSVAPLAVCAEQIACYLQDQPSGSAR